MPSPFVIARDFEVDNNHHKDVVAARASLAGAHFTDMD